jgi:transposase
LLVKLRRKSSGSAGEGYFIGIDLGDKKSNYCFMDRGEEFLAEDQLPTTLEAFAAYFSAIPKSRIALEVGTHSPWVSNLLESLGHEVYVANPRKMESIQKSKRKNDKKDARTLTRLVRADPELLYPIRHRGIQAREDLILLRARDGLVRARTMLINCVRGLVKSIGGRIPKCTAESFHKQAEEAIPENIRPMLLPIVEQIGAITAQIQKLDRQVEEMAEKKYPETMLLRQVKGVGAVTSLTYLLTLEKPERFEKAGTWDRIWVWCRSRMTPGKAPNSFGLPRLVTPWCAACWWAVLNTFWGRSDRTRICGDSERSWRPGAARMPRREP